MEKQPSDWTIIQDGRWNRTRLNKMKFSDWQNVTTSWCLCGFSRPTMQGTESVVAVLIPDTSFWLKCWDIKCQWLLCIGRLVSKHRQVMLDCMLGKTGNGEDHWCCSHNWSMRSTLEHVFCCMITGFAFTSESAYMVHQSNAGWHCWIVYCFWGGFTWGFALFPPGRTLKQCRTHQGWSMFGWLALSGSGGLCLGSMVTWQDLLITRTCQSWSAVHGVDCPRGDLSTSQSHVVKTTCDLDKSRSPFGGCVTMSWCLHGFSRPTMQGTESVVAVLIPDTSFWLKCWDIKCQWLLCIGRLVSKHRQVMLDCMLGKTGNGEDHWCSSHSWSMRSTPEHVFCCTDDWVCFYLGECLHGASVQCGLALLDRVLLLRRIHLGLCSFSPRKNTYAMQDPPGLIDVWVVGTVRFWRSLPWVHGDLAGPSYNQNLPELISCSWCGLPQRRS